MLGRPHRGCSGAAAPPRAAGTAADAAVREALCLQQHGFWPDMAEDGESAMLLLQKHDYDLLLFDVNLPGISGYALNSWYKSMCRDEGRATNGAQPHLLGPGYLPQNRFLELGY